MAITKGVEAGTPAEAGGYRATFLAFACALLVASAAEAKIAPDRLARVDAAILQAIANREAPGAVLFVGHGGSLVYRKAYGSRSLQPAVVPMTEDTVFDMASLTKVVATTTAVMQLVEGGKIRLSEPVAKYVPEFGNLGKERITIRELLTHHSGLPAGSALVAGVMGKDAVVKWMSKESLVNPIGEKFLYSDIDFIMLGELVERVSGQTLDRYTAEHIFQPLGMTDTAFNPDPGRASRAAPTEARNGAFNPGEVHDPRAYQMAGVAGHAGLFSTAPDLAIFCQMLLDGGVSNGKRILSPASIRQLGTPQNPPASPDRRGLGWDIDTSFSSNRGDLFAVPSFGHTGFTGTSLWIDPLSQTYVILLTNRVHPDGKGDVVRLRAQVANIVASSIEDYPLTAPSLTPEDRPAAPATGAVRELRVRTGADILAERGLRSLDGKRIGVIANHTTLASDGRRLVDAMIASKRFTVAALFSPEHGIEGQADSLVDSSGDAKTGLPIHSLYGQTRRPTPEMLRGLDALVFDIQDIGTRFYTYITTMAYAMEEAAKAGIPFVVLDRPNPINGLEVEGPVLDPDLFSFVGYMGLPTRHGMTVGELATMFNAEKKLGAKLEVVKMEGWERPAWFDQTGLVWINPSPNMTSLVAAALYPGIGTIEASVSVGRGTNSPFEKVGAPYIEPVAFARAMNAMGLEGVRFVPIRFTPNAPEHPFYSVSCGGVQIAITDRARMKPVDVGIGMASVLYRLYPSQYPVDKILPLLGSRKTLDAIKTGQPLDRITALWQAELQQFRRMRQNYLLY